MAPPIRASVEEALQVECPDCGAQAPNPCTYLPLIDTWQHGTYSKRVQARVALTGTPTLRPHRGRFTAAWELKVKRVRTERRKETANMVARSAASPELRAIARAHQRWDRLEWLRLAHWLQRHGHIFKDMS